MYRKEFNRRNAASVPDGQEIEAGWAVFKSSDDPDESDDLIAVVDTETLADALIDALTPAPQEWADNTIQFTRLLAEVNALGLTAEQEGQLVVSMDLHPGDLVDLFNRVEIEWIRIKQGHPLRRVTPEDKITEFAGRL